MDRDIKNALRQAATEAIPTVSEPDVHHDGLRLAHPTPMRLYAGLSTATLVCHSCHICNDQRSRSCII